MVLTDRLASGRAGGCESRLSHVAVTAADTCNHRLDFRSIRPADCVQVCRVWLCVHGCKKTCRGRSEDGRRKSEEREEEVGFQGRHFRRFVVVDIGTRSET